ncbi:hypothetical protein AMTR_s00040p00219120 [Amborella trichopoda]|uniref:Uncharacterized protein n=1 Tax=Amborella trichopoda TaxID=13333 RepID=W1PYX1_AMBTC|nr:hypothetical protein AMTR_s00040p00219120 [Amborella trichopoda]
MEVEMCVVDIRKAKKNEQCQKLQLEKKNVEKVREAITEKPESHVKVSQEKANRENSIGEETGAPETKSIVGAKKEESMEVEHGKLK